MSFATPINDVLGLQLAANYTAGSGTMTLQTGQGAKITSVPTLITVVVHADYQTGTGEIGNKAYYLVSAVAGDVLTVAVADGSADRNFSAGDYVDCRPEAKFIVDLNSAVATLQANVGTVPAAVLKGVSGALAAAVAGTDYVVPSGSITGTASNVTGTVTTAHGGTGLTAAPANGQLPIGNGTGYTLATLTPGTGISISDGAGSITIAISTPIPVSELSADSVTITAGAGLSGGGPVTLGGSTTISLSVPVSIADGGTGQTTAAAAFGALMPLTTTGDILYASAASTAARLAGPTSATRQYLTSTGTGTAAQAPAWSTIAAADMPVFVASGASHAPGAVPDPGSTAGTTRFLREDATWQVPSGSSYAPQRSFQTTSGSMTIPSTATILRLSAIGGGGSGGSGGRYAAGTAAYGGGGGGPAGGTFGQEFLVSDLLAIGTTISWSIGSGGAAVAPPSTDSTSGANGNAGGSTTVSVGAVTILSVTGGHGGNGGSTSNGNGGSTGAGLLSAGSGGNSSVTGNAANGTNSPYGNYPAAACGGGAGGGLSTGTVAYNGGYGGQPLWPLGVGSATPGTGGTTGGNGASGASPITAFSDVIQAGGGGAGGGACSSSTGVPGAGGGGASYGAGGGGAGATVNGVTLTGTQGYSGAGGGGCLLMEWF